MDKWHKEFDAAWKQAGERVRNYLIDDAQPVDDEMLSAAFIWAILTCPDDCDELTIDTKQRLLKIADELGPNWCQALYRAAVFMTKVA